MDIVVWLRSLGLGKYEAVIPRERDRRDGPAEFDARDLKELGVTAVGHRLKLLDAIAALRNDASVQGSISRRQHPRDHRLRRQLDSGSQNPPASADISR